MPCGRACSLTSSALCSISQHWDMPSDFKQEEANTTALNFYKYGASATNTKGREVFSRKTPRSKGCTNTALFAYARPPKSQLSGLTDLSRPSLWPGFWWATLRQNWRHCSPEMVLGTGLSKSSAAAATWFQEIPGAHGSAAAQRHHRHTMSLFNPEQSLRTRRCIQLQLLFHRWALTWSFPTAYFACCKTLSFCEAGDSTTCCSY